MEERISALEEAQQQAQERAQVAMATSENANGYSQLLALHDEMDTRLAEIKQVSLSVATLQAMFKNQSEEFEAVKESVVAGLSSSSALAENVAGLSHAVASAYAKADEQVASVEALNALLEGQTSELNEMKESMHLHNDALSTNNQEMAAIKWAQFDSTELICMLTLSTFQRRLISGVYVIFIFFFQGASGD